MSLIIVFLQGGLSTIDTLDLKPDAPYHIQITDRLERWRDLNEPVTVSLVVADHIAGVTADELTIPPGRKRGILTIRFAGRETPADKTPMPLSLGPFNMPVTSGPACRTNEATRWSPRRPSPSHAASDAQSPNSCHPAVSLPPSNPYHVADSRMVDCRARPADSALRSWSGKKMRPFLAQSCPPGTLWESGGARASLIHTSSGLVYGLRCLTLIGLCVDPRYFRISVEPGPDNMAGWIVQDAGIILREIVLGEEQGTTRLPLDTGVLS